MKRNFLILFLITTVIACQTAKEKTGALTDYPIQPISFTQVHFKDNFWAPRLALHQQKTLAYTLDQCYQTGRVSNLKRAAGLEEGPFCTTYPFDDSDVFKIMEGVSYSLQVTYDKELDQRLDTLIEIIGAAQEEDGYLYSNRTINPDSTHPWAVGERWEHTHELSHELYNMGHLYEAAAAHYWATGKRSLLDIALKNADLIDEVFGWGKLEREAGHQVIEMGLVKLYRITGDERYLNLAKFFLDVRGPDGEEYSQAHKKVVDQREAVGHAVRAMYMYAGMADVAALTQNQAYITAQDSIWQDVVSKKMYVTGGIGATGGNEGFADPYLLPNFSAYCETCAGIAHIFWNHRLFLLHGDSKYMDVVERTLYNALNSGLALSGDRFFYPNPLESRKNHERSPWFACACCPSNLARFLPSIPGYQYARRGDDLYVNLFIGGEATVEMNGREVGITQLTNYPWNGQVALQLSPEEALSFNLRIRIPGWAQNRPVPSDLYVYAEEETIPVQILVNGEETEYKQENGYALLAREWQPGDLVTVDFPMGIQKVLAHPAIADDRGKLALERGPLVYALEGKDQPDERVIHLMVDKDAAVAANFEADLLNGVSTLSFEGILLKRPDTSGRMEKETVSLKAIPYYAWANRGRDFMTVWLPYEESAARPTPAPTLAYRSEKEASAEYKGDLASLSDQLEPGHSNDRSNPFIHWWPRFGATEWVEYTFPQNTAVSKAAVYWFDDAPHGGCRVPASWRILYRSGNEWKPVQTKGDYAVTKDAFDAVEFEPVRTGALRLELISQEGVSSGVLEWRVE